MKRIVMCALAAVTTALGLATGVQAGVIGEVGNDVPCGGPLVLVQTASSGGVTYTIPSSGVVTSWSFAGGPSGTNQALVVLRPAGGSNYTVVGITPTRFVASDQVGTFSASIAVEAGDLVGEWFADGSGNCAHGSGSSGATLYWGNGSSPPSVGDVVSAPYSYNGLLNMAVELNGGSTGRAGYCAVAGNMDANGNPIAPGTFLNLGTDQPTSDPHYKGATPAYYYQGLGISCDSLPGYTKTGEMVGYGGHGDPGGYTYMARN